MEKKRKDVLREGDLGMEHGHTYLNLLRLPQAHKAYDIALFYNRQSVETYLGRSRMYERYLQYEKALDDINNALDVEPENLCTLQREAGVKFLKSNFEHGLIDNYRGQPFRKQPPNFFLGELECKEAIVSCIGEKAGPMLRDYYNKIKQLEGKRANLRRIAFENRWKRQVKIDKKLKESSGTELVTSKKKIKALGPVPTKSEANFASRRFSLPSYNQLDVQLSKKHTITTDDFKPTQAKTTNIKNFVAEKYLERMRFDKDLFYTCAKDPRVNIPNRIGNEKIHAIAARGYNECATCEESLRSRNPFYAIRYREMLVKKSLYNKYIKELQQVQFMTKMEADHLIAILRTAREHYQLRVCQQIVTHALDFFDLKNKQQLPRKDEYIEIMSNIIGLAYLDTLRVDTEGLPYVAEKRAKFMLGLPFSTPPSRDSLIKSLRPQIIDTKKEIKKTKARILRARSALQLSFLYYELARFLVLIKKYELSGYYARQSMKCADKIGNEVWAINSSFLMIRCFVNLRNRNDAKEQCNATIDRVRMIYYPNKELLLEFMTVCHQVIDELDYEELEAGDPIKERQSAILSIINTDWVQDQLHLLFRRMDTIPAIRRLSVMPGVAPKDSFERKPSTKMRDQSITNPNITKTKVGLQPIKGSGGDAFLKYI